MKYLNLDANESVFFERELTYVKNQTYDILYPELRMQTLLPVSFEIDNAAEVAAYHSYDSFGVAKVINNYSEDLPRVDVNGTEHTIKIRGIGDAYGYSIQEIRASARHNKRLEQRRGDTARKAIETKIDVIALKARPDDGENGGLVGLLYHPNTTKGTVPTRNGHVNWTDKTALEILADLNEGVSNMIKLTKGIEVPDTVLLPIDQWSKISTTPLQSGSDTTILQHFLKNSPMIKNVEWLAGLENVNPVPSTGAVANTNVMVIYRKDPRKLTLEIPQAFEQFDAQAQGLEYVVPCHARCAGVLIYYPLSVAIYEGL